jgi:hypothetical protein
MIKLSWIILFRTALAIFMFIMALSIMMGTAVISRFWKIITKKPIMGTVM